MKATKISVIVVLRRERFNFYSVISVPVIRLIEKKDDTIKAIGTIILN